MSKKKFWLSHSIFAPRLSMVDRLLFTRHLAIMLRSGMPLAEAIGIIEQQMTRPHVKKLLNNLEASVLNGQSIYLALQKHATDFDPVYLNLVRIGEESGTLEATLDYLALQQKKQYDFAKKVQGALLYPGLILTTATVVGLGISFFIMPKLVELFQSMDVDLPLSTRILIWIATLLKHYNYLILIGIGIIAVSFRLLIAHPRIKPGWHRLLLSLPVVGLFLQQVELTMIARNLGMMLKSGLPITTALATLEAATANLVYQQLLYQLGQQVNSGQSLETALDRLDSKQMPLLFTRMVGVGEKSGKLEEALLYISDFYEEEVDNTTKNMATLLEPIILLVIGLVVAFLAFSIIAPIYQLTGSIRR